MSPQDKVFIFACTANICLAIQWHAHYIKGEKLGLDTILILLLGVFIAYLCGK